MKEYIYPAIFHKNNDGSFTVTFPDLPGCITEGKTMGNALKMAQSALTQWIDFLHDEKATLELHDNLEALRAIDDVNNHRNMSRKFSSVDELMEDLSA